MYRRVVVCGHCNTLRWEYLAECELSPAGFIGGIQVHYKTCKGCERAAAEYRAEMEREAQRSEPCDSI